MFFQEIDMSDNIQNFGGLHTKRKLDVLAKYLAAYATVMKKKDFDLYYIDGFAGSGASSAKSGPTDDVDPTLFDTSVLVEGSPLRALNVSPPFDRYVFVDSNAKNVASLAQLKADFPDRLIDIHQGDANSVLAEYCLEISSKRKARAVVFLDPFGRSVNWDTVERLAATQKVDLWYLVPVHAISRQVTEKGEFLPSSGKTDAMCGTDEWRELAIGRPDVSGDLFGVIDDRLEKMARASEYSEFFRTRLASIFKGGVADRYIPLGRGRLHEFSLMFACANPSSAAFETALRIANHILRTS
jgi:three-Cys-motif partner protein